MKRPWSAEDLIEFVVDSARHGRADTVPFHHLQFDRVFPDDFYGEMLEAMPESGDYRAMSGKTKMGSNRTDGKPIPTWKTSRPIGSKSCSPGC